MVIFMDRVVSNPKQKAFLFVPFELKPKKGIAAALAFIKQSIYPSRRKEIAASAQSGFGHPSGRVWACAEGHLASENY